MVFALLLVVLPATTGALEPPKATKTKIGKLTVDFRLVPTNDPAQRFSLQVTARVRVCGRSGRAYFRIAETKSPPGENTPVLERGLRKVSQRQRGRCADHRMSWTVTDQFLGEARYRIVMTARTTKSKWSIGRNAHWDTRFD